MGESMRFGEGIIGGGQFSVSPHATSVMDLDGRSVSRGGGFADELGGSADWSNNAGGTLTITGGAGVGGWGAFRTEGPTTVVMLVCKPEVKSAE